MKFTKNIKKTAGMAAKKVLIDAAPDIIKKVVGDYLKDGKGMMRENIEDFLMSDLVFDSLEDLKAFSDFGNCIYPNILITLIELQKKLFLLELS